MSTATTKDAELQDATELSEYTTEYANEEMMFISSSNEAAYATGNFASGTTVEPAPVVQNDHEDCICTVDEVSTTSSIAETRCHESESSEIPALTKANGTSLPKGAASVSSLFYGLNLPPEEATARHPTITL